MYLEKESQILKQIGPFERAKTNLDKFVWNFMILYTTYALTEIWKSLETEEPEKALASEITAEVTIRGVFQLILDRDDGVWN